MEILLNGKPERIDAVFTASALIEKLQLTGKRIAIEVNGEIVPRSEYAQFGFSEGDRVEIVHAVGGG